MNIEQNLIAVYGVSGCGRGVMPLLQRMITAGKFSQTAQVVFVDDNPPADSVNGVPVLSYAELKGHSAKVKQVCIAIADSKTRQQLTEKCQADGISIISVSADNVVQMDDVVIGAGAILSPFVTLTSNIRIGESFQANLYSYVEHDCVIGDYVTFAPAVKCNGNVVIEDHAYIGAGAILRQGKPGEPLRIGRGAIVGMGAVVTKNVEAGTTVVGNPARLFVGK